MCVAPHGLRCMRPNRYSNRCEIIQPPSLMTAHMNSVSSEYPLWVNLHSSSGRAIRTHLAPRPPPPGGGRRSISHPRRLRSGGGSRISPCAPVPTTHRLGKGNVSRGTQCALPLARLCMGSRHDPLWSRVPTAEATEATRATHTGGVHAPCRAQMPQQCGATPHLDMRSRDAPFWHLRPACPGCF